MMMQWRVENEMNERFLIGRSWQAVDAGIGWTCRATTDGGRDI